MTETVRCNRKGKDSCLQLCLPEQRLLEETVKKEEDLGGGTHYRAQEMNDFTDHTDELQVPGARA